jgi:hypothetical protein
MRESRLTDFRHSRICLHIQRMRHMDFNLQVLRWSQRLGRYQSAVSKGFLHQSHWKSPSAMQHIPTSMTGPINEEHLCYSPKVCLFYVTLTSMLAVSSSHSDDHGTLTYLMHISAYDSDQEGKCEKRCWMQSLDPTVPLPRFTLRSQSRHLSHGAGTVPRSSTLFQWRSPICTHATI